MSGGVDPVGPEPVYTLPAETLEVAFYIYKKLDPTAPASWPNSGVQDLIVAVPGDEWFTEFPGDLPAYVCGPGWGVQQDKVAHDGSFVWPESIEYPHDNIGWPPIYDAQHTDLEQYVMVPDCVTATEPPAPVPERELAATGGDAWSWLLAGVLLVAVGGWALWASRSIEGES